jgi:hypothetical protein
LLCKYSIVQAECGGWEIEISIGWWEERGLVLRPLYVGKWRTWDTERDIAEITVTWRLCPHRAVIWFRRIANVSR